MEISHVENRYCRHHHTDDGRLDTRLRPATVSSRAAARRAAGQPVDATERLRDRADTLAARSAALRRLADAEKPLYQSLDEAQKRRFGIAIRFAARRHMAAAHPHGEGAPEHAR